MIITMLLYYIILLMIQTMFKNIVLLFLNVTFYLISRDAIH